MNVRESLLSMMGTEVWTTKELTELLPWDKTTISCGLKKLNDNGFLGAYQQHHGAPIYYWLLDEPEEQTTEINIVGRKWVNDDIERGHSPRYY